jgi:hypothetical protein
MIGDKVTVNDRMQKSYEYVVSESIGKNLDPSFEPYLSPKEMLQMGIFEGKYCNDCRDELPSDWFKNAKQVNSQTQI